MGHNFKIKSFSDERSYHNTAIMIYLKAAKEITGLDMRIGNSLNQGYFSYANRALSSTEIHKIWNRMDQIIENDIPLLEKEDTASHAMKKWETLGCTEKAGLLRYRDPEETVIIAELGGYRNCMYCHVLPSAGYIDLFELRQYRNGVLLRLPNALNPDSIPDYRDDDKLYDAFARSNKLRKKTGIRYLADINDRIHDGLSDDIIRANEWLQRREIKEIAETIVEGGKKIVLIAGPSSSGKTTTAKRLCEAIAELTSTPLYLGTDDYFVERSQTPLLPDGTPDFEGLGALDLDLFNMQMDDLLAGKEVDIPEFDFIYGKKTFGKRITKLEQGQILVIEGIHSLNDVLTQNIDRRDKFKIYISPLTQLSMDRHNRVSTADARLLRRMVRDNQFRGYNAEATLEAWPKVRAGESVNIFPYSSSADVVFNSSTVYETNMLRTFAEPLLEAIDEDSKQYVEAQRILNFIKYFVKIENTEAVPDNAILREFIGPRKQAEDGGKEKA